MPRPNNRRNNKSRLRRKSNSNSSRKLRNKLPSSKPGSNSNRLSKNKLSKNRLNRLSKNRLSSSLSKSSRLRRSNKDSKLSKGPSRQISGAWSNSARIKSQISADNSKSNSRNRHSNNS